MGNDGLFTPSLRKFSVADTIHHGFSRTSHGDLGGLFDGVTEEFQCFFHREIYVRFTMKMTVSNGRENKVPIMGYSLYRYVAVACDFCFVWHWVYLVWVRFLG